MFYCEDCRFERNWPQSMTRSQGKCEICEKGGQLCYDVPSSKLPKSDKEEEPEPTIYELLATHLGLTETKVINQWTNRNGEMFMLTQYGFRRIIPGKQAYTPEDLERHLENYGNYILKNIRMHDLEGVLSKGITAKWIQEHLNKDYRSQL